MKIENGRQVLTNGDTISGKQGTVIAQIDGRNEPIAHFKTIKAKMDVQKSSIPVLGKSGNINKKSGWSGKGESTLYEGSNTFKKMASKYGSESKDTYFDMVMTNDDPTSSVGRQVILLRDCNFDSIDLAALDITSDDPLEVEMEFTFDGFEYLEHFTDSPITVD